MIGGKEDGGRLFGFVGPVVWFRADHSDRYRIIQKAPLKPAVCDILQLLSGSDWSCQPAEQTPVFTQDASTATCTMQMFLRQLCELSNTALIAKFTATHNKTTKRQQRRRRKWTVCILCALLSAEPSARLPALSG